MKHFGTLPDGREAKLYTLQNENGLRAAISDFGATLVSLEAPDREGKIADLVLGYDSVDGYTGEGNPYFGATVGRFGNRIAGGRFSLDGKTYQLATNNAPGDIPCHLHGGEVGFNKRLWTVKDASRDTLTLEYISPDGEEGYPGKLTTRVTYRLTEANELYWEAEATTDAPTIVNLVQHSYWNLSNNPGASIHGHILQLHADHYLPTNGGAIPTGERAAVDKTPMDFRQAGEIGPRLEAEFAPIRREGGFDYCFVVRPSANEALAPVACLQDPESGRVMELFSNQPGVQFYSANYLDGSQQGKDGIAYGKHGALCLETQNFPDAPNQADFPSPVLRPGETYRHTMRFRFSAK